MQFVLNHAVGNPHAMQRHIAECIDAIPRKTCPGTVYIILFRNSTSKCFFYSLFADHKTQQPAPGSRRVVGIPTAESAYFYGFPDVALAVKKAHQAGCKVNAGGKAAVDRKSTRLNSSH